MNGRIGVVTDAQEEHLPVELVNTAHGAAEAMRWVKRMGSGDSGRERADRSKRVGAVAPEDSRLSPKSFRHNTHSGAWGVLRIERVIVVASHAWHHERAAGAKRAAQPFNQGLRSTVQRV